MRATFFILIFLLSLSQLVWADETSLNTVEDEVMSSELVLSDSEVEEEVVNDQLEASDADTEPLSTPSLVNTSGQTTEYDSDGAVLEDSSGSLASDLSTTQTSSSNFNISFDPVGEDPFATSSSNNISFNTNPDPTITMDTAVPEPSSWLLMTIAILGLFRITKTRKS